MNTNRKSALKGINGLLYPLVGLALLVAFLLFLNTLFISRASQTANQEQRSDIQPLAPTTAMSPTPGRTASNAHLMGKWKVYTDPVTGFSFRYPEEWSIAEAEPGLAVRLLNLSSSYYRGIEFVIEENPTRLDSPAFAAERFRESYGDGATSLHSEPFGVSNISGTKLTGFPEGILAVFVVNHEEIALRISLIEGGEIGGAPASSFPTALEDEQVLLQILDTFEFFPQQ